MSPFNLDLFSPRIWSSLMTTFGFRFFWFHMNHPSVFVYLVTQTTTMKWPDITFSAGWQKVLHRQRRISSIAKTPNICCFVAKLHLLRFTRFFRGNIPILSWYFKYVCHIYRTEKLSIEQEGDLQNRMAINRTDCLSIEQNGYR